MRSNCDTFEVGGLDQARIFKNACGVLIAVVRCMKGIWKFEDLVAWQLAVQLQTLIDRLCEREAIKSDVKFHSQLADAAASGPRNIAEGFGRYYHPEFARFARIAKASEQEVLNHLYRARNKNYITVAEFEDSAWATRKALKAVNGLIRYLDATPHHGKQ